MFPTRECPLPGCREEDTLPHLLSCSSLQVEEEQHRTNYSDIYSGSLEQQLAVTRRFALLLEARERAEKGLPAARIAGSPAPVDTVCNVMLLV